MLRCLDKMAYSETSLPVCKLKGTLPSRSCQLQLKSNLHRLRGEVDTKRPLNNLNFRVQARKVMKLPISALLPSMMKSNFTYFALNTVWRAHTVS